MLMSRCFCVQLCFIVLFAAGAAMAEQRVEILFNGRDLTGWEGDPDVWSVEDGAITGRNTAEDPIEHNTFLVWQGEDLGDFELTLQYRIVDGNSGIQYRSKLLDAEKWIVGGYQADIEAGKQYTGILYDERGRGILALRGQRATIDDSGEKTTETFADAADLQKKIRHEDWNDYRIVARGSHLQHWINDTLMSEVRDDESEKRAASGILALQVHTGPPMVVQFRELRLKRFEARDEAGREGVPSPNSDGGGGSERQPLRQSEREPLGQQATPVDAITTLPGFAVDLVYSVPRESQGSWVAMTGAPGGRLIVSDQKGQLYWVTPAASRDDTTKTVVEPLDLPIGAAQGLLWAHDSLYVMVNAGGDERAKNNGLYRVQDTDGDGKLDTARLLKLIDGHGEHGPHAVILAAGGEHLYVICGNDTRLVDINASRVPTVWDEDQVLPRMWDANGHAVGRLAPGGWIARTDLDGEHWELVSSGYRNAYDIALHESGELFSFDADMEWDVGAPWYRPTRICHATSGSEFGWRSGTGKWPASYPDSLPAVLDLGTGSPTGITFGYGAKFPAQYQQALFACDWSFGKLYAIHLKADGATFRGMREEFLTGAPLPLTDVVIHPDDGAMYFAIGGRGTKSALYRVRYVGNESIAKPSPATRTAAASLRRSLERFHGRVDSDAVDMAWPHLDHADRFVRFAARTAVEWQPVGSWQQRSLEETRPQALLEAMVALARHGDADDESLPPEMLAALAQIDWHGLSHLQKVSLLRAYGLIVVRLAALGDDQRAALADRINAWYPAGDVELNQELCRLLVRLDAPDVVAKTLTLLEDGLSQEEQIHYALALRNSLADASNDEQRRYFQWFRNAGSIRGGHSLRMFLKNIRNEAMESMDETARDALADLLVPLDDIAFAESAPPRPFVKEYTTDEVAHLIDRGLADADRQRGRRLFGAAQCAKCHRLGNEGGATGPDLTTLALRFGSRDIAEAIVEPSKVISDRFRAITVELESGQILTGRVGNLRRNSFDLVTDMLAPGELTTVDRAEVISIEPSPVSVMPTGLLNTLDESEVRDLLAFITSAASEG